MSTIVPTLDHLQAQVAALHARSTALAADLAALLRETRVTRMDAQLMATELAPMQDPVAGHFYCTPKSIWRPSIPGVPVHRLAYVVDDLGRAVLQRCPCCKTEWVEELPQ